VVPASRVEASGWERRSVVVSAALKKDVSGGKNSEQCSIETQENIYISKVGVGKRERQ
jgi:hypothetical protein